ncbi:polyphosphate kinase 1 [Endozoicomonas sp. SM1973]|uniref:Polyphosphate kinase n=1 Tax=Spartinivicinus marinus TaxID=2994442 RepID=A0A853IA09_9GAMM|nr:polyphosphate kinase 1 [Spartinivicinus marinus]MCX4027441.1 polyphosphate kinase 1 [Spartinivicinus marinus]NYZ66387.1 polyphosphate kinase 1 [Spartinivicinus marinus]
MSLTPATGNNSLQSKEEPTPPEVSDSLNNEEPLRITDLSNPEYYINRELSHLQFNARVLEQPLNDNYPLLERLRFLLIFSSNLDEFFEIRVAGLKQQIAFAREKSSIDGLQPQQALDEISRICHQMVQRQYEILNDVLLPALAEENIRFLRRSQLNAKQAAWVSEYYYQQIMPVISPIGLDPAHPFPRLANKILNFIVSLEGKDAFGRETGMAIIPAPRSLPRLIRIPDEVCNGGDNYIFLSSIIHHHVEDLFPGMTVTGCYQFRLTRNSDLSVDSEEVEDLARALQGELLARRYGDAVRLEIAANCPKELSTFLLEHFGLSSDELYEIQGPVNLTRLMDICNAKERPDLLYVPFSPGFPKIIQKKNADMMQAIRRSDILLLHPFESFTPIVDLVRQAAKDPEVLAIKQTLYRTGSNSELVDALVEAARNGKEITVVIEIRARFDEEDNLLLASRLQEAGAVIVYGVVGYKTHAKMLLIVRREGKKMQRYVHLGTGNYHAGNARIYTDYSLLTCDKSLTEDVHKIFQQLTGMGKVVQLKKLLHAPFTLKKSLVELIYKEAHNAKEGKPAHIIIKVNALTETKVMKALFRASQVGVKIDLIIRGICCLRPGIPGLSENIRVRSIVGRFLEHTRVYYFQNDDAPKVYCASADWMERNLDNRIETCFPIENPKLVSRVKRELDIYLTDNCMSWQLQSDGSYTLNTPGEGEDNINVQQKLLEKLGS